MIRALKSPLAQRLHASIQPGIAGRAWATRRRLPPHDLRICTVIAAVLILQVIVPAAKAAPWLLPGDSALRHDIQLLADEGIIPAPVTTWPMSWPDIARAVLDASPSELLNPGVQEALMRVQSAARDAERLGPSLMRVTTSAAEKPIELRSFSETPRDEGELTVDGEWLGERFAVGLSVTAVQDPSDDQSLRLDGSYLGVTLGNFMVSAGSMGRWWGPGWEGSLILSTNARPIPSIAIERNYSEPFQSKLLSWIGPWRAVATLGQLEGSDVAVPDTRFFSARVSFRPRPWLEIGLSRTAQWCGEGRACNLEVFGDLLLGRDNSNELSAGEEEPGNQMAGYDFRLRIPRWGIPVALYGQFIGEDEAGGLPSRFLGLLGVEWWGWSAWGSYRLHAEFADTACNFMRANPLFNCAYRSGLYPQGYTYRGRTIGHSLDGDGRMYSLGMVVVRSGGDSLSLLIRTAELNRDGSQDPVHTVSSSHSELKNLELQYNRPFARGELGVGLGFDDVDGPQGGSDVHGFVRWQQGF